MTRVHAAQMDRKGCTLGARYRKNGQGLEWVWKRGPCQRDVHIKEEVQR